MATSSLPSRLQRGQPASSAQQRMWFLYQLAPKSGRYNVSMTMQIRGQLQVPLLDRCLSELVARHEALRTTFAIREEGIVQIIHPSLQSHITLVDLRSLSQGERTARLQQLIEQAEQCPFDLTQLPLFRIQLVWLEDQGWLLQSVFHHAVTDGWSQERFYQELSLLYNALVQGHPSPLAPDVFQYSDYTRWQQQLAGSLCEKQLTYWQQRLDGVPALLELPTDYPRPEHPNYAGASSRFLLSQSISERIHAFTRETNTTPFMFLLAAFQLLLFRYTGQEDIVVGSPAAGRSRPEFEQIQGLFINTLALHSHISTDRSFRQILQEIRQTCLGAYANQEIPFDQVVESLHLERSLRYQPLCQAMFSYHLISGNPLELLGCDVKLCDTSQVAGGFDLVLDLCDGSEGLAGTWSYSTELFSAERIRRQSGHFQRIVEQALTLPDQPVGSYELLTLDERKLLLETWNETTAPYPPQRCIHHLVEEQARLQPEALAVSTVDGQEISYQELNRRANQLAYYLQLRGIEPQTLVGVCMERSLELIVAQLALLKLGAAYVPLAPDYPTDRLAFLLRDTEVPFVLTLQRFQACLPLGESAYTVVVVDHEMTTIARMAGENPQNGYAGADTLAYVLYTSGSTGQPKGVCISHQAVVVRLASEGNTVSWHPGDRVAHVSHPCFDASTFEVWGALMNGATVVILEKDDLLSPTRLARLLREKRISFLFLTTALFNQFASTMPEVFDSLQTLVFGGEAVNPNAARAMLDHPHHPQSMINAYGPTECAMYVTCFTLEQWDRQGFVPIGGPVANTEIFLLDEHMLPVPIGIPAEICAGGPGLAQGYLQRPDLTVERFVPHPFRKGEKLYRTGDLGVYQENGILQFVGRTDRQVKLRGYRIELGEIDAALREHPSVRDALVRIHEASFGERQLVAYLTPSETWDEKEQSINDLRAFLAAKLPGYMVPTVLICIDEWPLSSSGKIAYRELPPPSQLEGSQSEFQQEVVPARTDLEHFLVDLWQELFAREPLGIHDQFFELGGHSLLAARLVGRLSAHIGREVSVTALFEHPTIAQLASFAQSLLDAETDTYVPLISSSAALAPESAIELRQNEAAAFTVRENRTLLPLLLSGQLPPVDAVTLGYLGPHSFPRLRREEVIADLFEGLPIVAAILETPWGRMAAMPLPLFEDQLFEKEALLQSCQQALQLAKQIGARAVTLGGILPVAANLGEVLPIGNFPPASTGHGAIAAAIVLALKRIATAAGRNLENEQLCVLGIGPIAQAVFPLLLSHLPHPRTIGLCDLYATPEALEACARQLRLLGYAGEIVLLAVSGGHLPREFYHYRLIVSMTNVADVIEVGQLASGTLLVDDSIPCSFQLEDARDRLESRGDLLFTQGRMLYVPEPLTQLTYLPPRWSRAMAEGDQAWQHLQARDPHLIPACALSSLLSSHFALPPTIGKAETEATLAYYRQMSTLGIEAAPLAYEGYTVPAEKIADFRRQFYQSPSDSAALVGLPGQPGADAPDAAGGNGATKGEGQQRKKKRIR